MASQSQGRRLPAITPSCNLPQAARVTARPPVKTSHTHAILTAYSWLAISTVNAIANQDSFTVLFRCFSIWFVLLTLASAQGQTLNLPLRSASAPNGTQFTNLITTLSNNEREQWMYAQIISGNVPNWLRILKPITNSAGANTVIYHVTPDYFAIGSDTDYFRAPMTPLLAQRLADRLGCSLPTRRMVNQIWTNAPVKLSPIPFNPEVYDIDSAAIFAASDAAIDNQRNAVTNLHPLGTLVGGTKKDVIISNQISNRPPPPRVVIYGWHNLSGSVIQELSAVHENTYADYSHGIRFIQTNLTVNAAPGTVAGVLGNPALNSLLSDEGLVPQPRYPLPALGPTVMTPPRSQSVLPGTNLMLNTLVIGDEPLRYQWRLNGANLATATNATLALTNLTTANAGNYSVVVTNTAGSATSRVAVVRIKTSDFPLLFRDDFNTNSAANWNIFWGAANNTPDYSADFAFDYGVIPYTFNGVTALIPPAPNSPDDSTRGVRLAVNRDASATNAAVNLYPKNFSVSGNFALKFDLWINYPGCQVVRLVEVSNQKLSPSALLRVSATWPLGWRVMAVN